MRTRSIKPGFFDNDILGDLPALTRLLFIGLWCMADRDGRLEDRPKRINKELMGYDDLSSGDVDAMLQQLHNAGFIQRYTAQGKQYIQVVNFTKHQNPHIKEKASEIPGPESCVDIPNPEPTQEEATAEHQTSTRQAPDKHGANTEQATLVTGNRLLVTGNRLPTPMRAPAREEDNIPTDKSDKKSMTPATAKRFADFWTEYPKKQAKANAQRAWQKIHPDAELFGKIMQAVRRQKQSWDWQKAGGQYIPYPATWLNGGYWDNETEVTTDGENRGCAREYGAAFAGPGVSGLAGNGFTLAGDPDER